MTTDIVAQRLHAQHLTGTPLATPEEIVTLLGAIQAQDYLGAKWAIAQRSHSLTSQDIDKALNDGRILRTHVMRPTWHFVMPQDIRWLLELTAPRVHAINAYYCRKSGLTDAVLAKSETILAAALAGTQCTRAEIKKIIEEANIDTSGMRLGFILLHNELRAVICSGAIRGKQHTYALFKDRVPETAPVTRNEALTRLAARYFTSHGPAQLKDFSWWSGLTMSDVRHGAELAASELETIKVDEKLFFKGKDAITRRHTATAHLLPNYDEYLIAYKDHSISFDASRFTTPPKPGAFDRHILVMNGMVMGSWRADVSPSQVEVSVQLLAPVSSGEEKAIQKAVERYGHFIERQAILSII